MGRALYFRTGDAQPLAEPPLPAVPEASEGALPQAPGPAIPAEIGAHGASAGQAAAEAQPDAAAQPVQVCCDITTPLAHRHGVVSMYCCREP